MAERERLSVNLITLGQRSLREAVELCARRSIPYVGPWRDKVEATGLPAAAALVEEHGVRVSSLCRGGFFPAPTSVERQARIDENKRAIDEAATLGTDVLVLVCGPAEGQSLVDARAQIADGIATLESYARGAGVRLGVEPLHPMLCASRSAITTLAEANDIVAAIGSPYVGVVVDAYHVWWDPNLEREIARSAGTIVGFHVSDWETPNGDALASRLMMGDGCIDLRGMRKLVEKAGYRGPIEVEVINPRIATTDGDDLLALIEERYAVV